MQNSYLVDIFLTFWAWFILFFLYFSTIKLKNKACQHINQHLLEHSIRRYGKVSLTISLCFMSAFSFLLWRFAVVLLEFKAFGQGSIGLLVIMWLAGFILSWLKSIFSFTLNGFGIDAQTDNKTAKHENQRQFFINNKVGQ